MTEQEQNWELMSWLSMTWFDCEKLDNKDKEFLLTKVVELKEQSKQYYAAQEAQAKAQAEAAQATYNQQQPEHTGPTTAEGRPVRPW
jgi:hypothetical protein